MSLARPLQVGALVSVRCAQHRDVRGMLRRHGASDAFIERRTSGINADLFSKAVKNFSGVWRRWDSSASRYSDGSHCV
jgi:hypothetical protein